MASAAEWGVYGFRDQENPDWSLTGTAVSYFTDEFLSADPLDPSSADHGKW